MIGIVVVSHSAKVAEGARDIANQMTQGAVPIALAGGIDDPENPIGTDATRVYAAIEEVFSEDGVLVLMDLGSALLSTEMALEDFLTEEQRKKVRLCEAPLVEGLVAAATQATFTNDIDQIIAEARGALEAKKRDLSKIVPDISAAPIAQKSPTITPEHEIQLTIPNAHGLHARPAARFVRTAARFDAEITVRNLTQNQGPVNAKSINQVATLGARQGHEVAVAAAGPEAEAALAALEELARNRFGEADSSAEPAEAEAPQPTPAPAAAPGELTGTAVSPGIAVGPAVRYSLIAIEVEEEHVEDSQGEWERLQTALKAARQEIETLHKQAAAQVGDQEAAIFEAHLLFLEDPDFIDAARQNIFEQQINVEAGWQAMIKEKVAVYRTMEDEYMQARAADVADVGQRVLRHLQGQVEAALELTEPAILVAADLTPSDTAQLDPAKVLGLCTELGNATSHSAILARALGIPAVVGVGPALAQVEEGQTLGLDGKQGRLWIEPNEEKLATLKAERETWLEAQEAAKAASQQPAMTRDGRRVEVAANIGGLADVQPALDNGAEGVGLLRTEFLYLQRTTAPNEEEQVEVYQAIAEALGDRPLIIRTLDIGGDKPLPYLELEPEDNPFLGWRGIRLCLDRPDIFQTQLRAILRASPGHQFKLMFPMISSLTELRQTKKLLGQVQEALRQEEIAFSEEIEVGVMIELPAAVVVADRLAAEVDFFSLGTNDLSQYVMAADRTNARVGGMATPFQPAVLRMIRQTIDAAHAAGIWVGLCGEFAGNPLATPLLLGLGLDEFSMSGPAIPEIKQTIGRLSVEEAQTIAAAALELESAEAVEAYLKEQLSPE